MSERVFADAAAREAWLNLQYGVMAKLELMGADSEAKTLRKEIYAVEDERFPQPPSIEE